MQEVTIKKDPKIVIDKNIKEFLNPRFIFLPIKDDFKLKVGDNDYVYKNDIVAMDKHGHIMYSSISGRVLGVKRMPYYGGKEYPSLVIENDFKENIRARKSAKKYITDYTRKEFLDIIRDTSLYVKGEYLSEKLDVSNVPIIINAIDPEPYFYNRFYLFKENIEEILETVDLIGSIVHSPRIVLAIKNSQSELINKLMDILGTYPNIELKLVNDAYPNGLDTILKRMLSMKDALVIPLEEIWTIYESIKRTIPVTEKLISIVGNGVAPSSVVKVKVGSLLSEAFVSHFNFTAGEVEVYLNGMMQGDIITSLKIIIDTDIDGILIMRKSKETPERCIKCGLCSKHCPMGLNPKYVFDHAGRVKPEYYDACIGCGLCNYVCPSNIDLKSIMRRRD